MYQTIQPHYLKTQKPIFQEHSVLYSPMTRSGGERRGEPEILNFCLIGVCLIQSHSLKNIILKTSGKFISEIPFLLTIILYFLFNFY